MSLNSHWTKHLSKDDYENQAEYDKALKEVGSLFSNSDRFREVLYTILGKRSKEKEQQLEYDSPGWPYKRAAQDGYIQAMKDIQKLLMVDK